MGSAGARGSDDGVGSDARFSHPAALATTLNGASLVVLTYFLYMRAKAGSTAVYHFLGLFERCLPAWWKEN